MSDWDSQWERAEARAQEELEERDRGGSPVIGRITQLTETPGIPLTVVWFGCRRTTLPSGRIVPVAPLYKLYVFRQNGQAGMIVTRVSPFQYEQMYLTDLEMQVVMDWAYKMVTDRIGRFTPADGGWMWWTK